jgi:hypothetical protein
VFSSLLKFRPISTRKKNGFDLCKAFPMEKMTQIPQISKINKKFKSPDFYDEFQ